MVELLERVDTMTTDYHTSMESMTDIIHKMNSSIETLTETILAMNSTSSPGYQNLSFLNIFLP